MIAQELELETWGERAERLARALLEARPDPFTSSKAQRERYARLRYELHLHLEEVPPA